MNVDLAKQSQISEADQRSSPYLWRLRQSAEKLAAAAPHAAHKTRALFPPADDARQHARGGRDDEREAIEKRARATVKRQGYREDQWRQYPTHVEFAENIVVALEALGLLKPSS
jgi:hypothetical protein